MSKLLVKPSPPDSRGRVHSITPASAGWTYVGFDVYRLKAGQSLRDETGDREACIVMLAGKAHVSAGGKNFGIIGGRASPFEPPTPSHAPHSTGRLGLGPQPGELGRWETWDASSRFPGKFDRRGPRQT